MKRSYLFVVSVALVVTSVLMVACGTANSITATHRAGHALNEESERLRPK